MFDSGVAYSRHIVQIYSYQGGDDVRQHLEVDNTLCMVSNCQSLWIYFFILSTLTASIYSNAQIDAHVGGVNDLAFSHPNKQLCVITCGDDKTIKVFYLFIHS